LYFNTSVNAMRVWTGSAWTAISSTTGADADQIVVTPAGGITSGNVQLALEELDAEIASVSFAETDPVFSASASAGISTADINNWDAAYGWGNHASAGYLTSETDPVFTASAAAGIAAGDITNWNTAYGWGNHASAGYAPSLNPSFTGEVYTSANQNAWAFRATTGASSNASGLWFTGENARILLRDSSGAITTQISASGLDSENKIGGNTIWHAGNFPNNSSNWNTAYNWGNHASAGYLTSFDITTQTDPKYLRSDTNDTATGLIAFNQGIGAVREDGVDVLPTSFTKAVHWKFQQAAEIGGSPPGAGSWRHLMTVQTWTQHSSAYPSYQMSFGRGAIGVRESTSNTVWGGWKTLLWSSNPPSAAITAATGQYGSFEVSGGPTNSYEGYSIAGRVVFMHRVSGGHTGIYDDTNNNWMFYAAQGGESRMYHNGSKKIYTYSFGGRVTGNLLASSNVFAYYSDERLKTKTGIVDGDGLLSLDVFKYEHNELAQKHGYEKDGDHLGVSAQQVKAHYPEAVALAPFDNDGEGNSISGEEYLTVQYDRLVVPLIAKVKDQQRQIDELKAMIMEIAK